MKTELAKELAALMHKHDASVVDTIEAMAMGCEKVARKMREIRPDHTPINEYYAEALRQILRSRYVQEIVHLRSMEEMAGAKS